MKFKKIMTFFMIGAMMMAPLGTHRMVQAASTEVVAEETTQEEILSKVLVKVKNVITIPKDYSEFSYSYNNDKEEPSWYLSWYQKDGKGSIDINCDNNGNVLSYYLYNDRSQVSTPKFLQSELKGKADAFLKKVAKDQYSSLSYKSAYYNGVYSNRYSFVYERIENGIPVPDNQMVVSLDAQTGEVQQFDTSWDYDVSMPKSDVKITKEKATSLLQKELEMKLEYHIQHSEDGETMKTKLLYVPNKNYLAVDAKNGKVYDTRVNDSYYDNYKNYMSADTGASMTEEAKADRDVLTEEEIAKIDELSGLISKKEAIASLKKYADLYIDSAATEQSATLYDTVLDDSKPETKSYIWRITLYDPKPMEERADYNYSAYINATVDAKTGKVIDFDAANKTYNYGTDTSSYLKYSEEEGLKKAQSFIKKYYIDLYKQTEYTDCYDGYVISYTDTDMNYGGKVYTFTRVSNGIPFPENQITVGVDLVTGKIYNFSYSWYENVTFDAPANVITAEAAKENYLNCEGYDLVYEINTTYENEQLKKEVRLVYRTEIYPGYIDATTGKQVTYDGTELSSDTGYAYTDISGSPYERTIKILADMGIGFNSSLYLPNEAITKNQFSQLLQSVYIYDIRNSLLSGTGTITREEAAKYAIQTLNLDYIAKLDVFKSEYKDSSQITPSYLGYVVLADELGLVTNSSDANFRPQEALTRGEAAQLILQLLSNYNKN